MHTSIQFPPPQVTLDPYAPHKQLLVGEYQSPKRICNDRPSRPDPIHWPSPCKVRLEDTHQITGSVNIGVVSYTPVDPIHLPSPCHLPSNERCQTLEGTHVKDSSLEAPAPDTMRGSGSGKGRTGRKRTRSPAEDQNLPPPARRQPPGHRNRSPSPPARDTSPRRMVPPAPGQAPVHRPRQPPAAPYIVQDLGYRVNYR